MIKTDPWQTSLNLTNLKIARKNVGLSSQDATNRVYGSNVNEIDKIKLCEEGSLVPTYKQLEKLADLYNVNIFQFLIEENLTAVEEPVSFRSQTDIQTSYNLHRFINILRTRRDILRTNMIEEGADKNRLVGSGRGYTDPAQLATFIGGKLNYDLDRAEASQDALAYLRSLLHSQQIFVFKTMATKRDIITKKEMKGLYLHDDYAPCIALNRRDHKNSQLFTLAHEVVHLFRATERVDSIDFRSLETISDQEEIFCNQVAANILIPNTKIPTITNQDPEYLLNQVKIVAKANKVSNLVSLFRLASTGQINQTIKEKIKHQLNLEYEEHLKSQQKNGKKTTGGNYYNNMRDSNGSLFSQFVFSLHLDGKLNAVEVQNLLRVPFSEI